MLKNIWRIINTIAFIWHKNIIVYLSVNNICSLNLTVFLKLCFLKTTIRAYFGIKWRPLFIYLRLTDIFICVCILTYIMKIPCTLTFTSYWTILMLKFSCLNKVYCSTVKLPHRHYSITALEFHKNKFNHTLAHWNYHHRFLI